MFSRGALNGAPLNEIELNGGGFVHEAAAVGSVSVTGAADMHRRQAFSATGTIVVTGVMTNRVSVRADSIIGVTGTAGPVRRATGVGNGQIAVHGILDARRRASMLGSSAIVMTGQAVFIHRVLRRAPEIRVMTMLPGRRDFDVSTEPRCHRVSREPRAMIVHPDRRAA